MPPEMTPSPCFLASIFVYQLPEEPPPPDDPPPPEKLEPPELHDLPEPPDPNVKPPIEAFPFVSISFCAF